MQAGGRLLSLLAARLCAERGDLLYLQLTSRRLPPEMEDSLRLIVAEHLYRAGRSQLAEEVMTGIRSSEARRTALLDLWPERAESFFQNPESLYATFAHVEGIEDERLGLTALFTLPADLEDLAERWLQQMTPGPTATAAVTRIARHALAFQKESRSDRRDALAVLHFIERALTANSLRRNPAWLPTIVEIGASLGSHRLPLELHAAIAELLSQPWEESREIFEDLLFRLRTSLPPRQRAKALLTLFRSLQEIPDAKSRRERTLQLLPLLTAAAGQIPGVQRVFRQAGEMAFREDPSPSPAGFVAQICAFDQARRIEAAEMFIRGQDEIALGAPFHALALLVSQEAPETAVALIRRTPPDSLRDEACRRMIRYQWTPTPQARELLSEISQSFLALEAGLFLEDDAEPWLQLLARLATNRGCDPSAPSSGPILDRLWQIDPGLSRPCLADAVVAALRTGPENGEQAIRLWLHAHLPPRLGAAQAERLHESEEVAGALRQALTLATPDASQQPVSLPDTPSPAELGQMALWYRRWKQVRNQVILLAVRQQDTWVAFHVFTATAILFLLADFDLDFGDTETWIWPYRLLAWPYHLLVWTHTSPAWVAVLAVSPLNALLIHRILAEETPHEDLRSWVPKLRFLLGGIPLLGLYMLPAWRKIMKSRPAWAFRRNRTNILDEPPAEWASVPQRSFSSASSWLSRLQSSPVFLFLWLWIINLVAVRLATSRLSAADILSSDLRNSASWTLHLLGFAATASLLRADFQTHPVTAGDRKACWILAGTWFFPFPITLIALAAPWYPWLRRQATGTLSAGTQGANSAPEWSCSSSSSARMHTGSLRASAPGVSMSPARRACPAEIPFSLPHQDAPSHSGQRVSDDRLLESVSPGQPGVPNRNPHDLRSFRARNPLPADRRRPFLDLGAPTTLAGLGT